MLQGFHQRIERALRVNAQTKGSVYATVYESAEISSLRYWLAIVFSSGIATLGLVENSPAVIIGAMLISPLMGPIMSAGLALAVGDLYLGIKAAINLALSIAVSVGLAAVLVWVLPFHTATGEILSRIHPNLLDLGIAILSGLAGSVVVCTADANNGAMVLPGVAIAVALMPPLCVAGFGVGDGFNREIMTGASLLFLTNLVAIVSSAFAMFLLMRMGDPALRGGFAHTQQQYAEKEKLYLALRGSALGGVLRKVGALHWRMIMLLVLLGALFVPLRSALVQLKQEAAARTAVRSALNNLLPKKFLASQQVDYSPAGVSISLLSTQPVSGEKISAAEHEISATTGKSAEIAVQVVASHNQLAELMDRMSHAAMAPPVPAPGPVSAADAAADLQARLKSAMDTEWPATVPLLSYGLTLAAASPASPAAEASTSTAKSSVPATGKTATVSTAAPSAQVPAPAAVVALRYQSAKALDPMVITMLQQALRTQLGLPNLTVQAQRVAPPRSQLSRARKGAHKPVPR